MSSICYTVFHRQNMSTLQTDNNWSKYTRKWFDFNYPPWDFGSGGTKSSAFLCLHAEKISFLELRVAISGLKTMVNSFIPIPLSLSIYYYPCIPIPLSLYLYPNPLFPILLFQYFNTYSFIPITLSISLKPYPFITIFLPLSIYPYPFIPIF